MMITTTNDRSISEYGCRLQGATKRERREGGREEANRDMVTGMTRRVVVVLGCRQVRQRRRLDI